MNGEKLITKFEEEPPKQRSTCRCIKAYISLLINELNQKWQIRRVRANVCPHSAITLALTAESTMNKGIEKKYGGHEGKNEKKLLWGRIAKAEFKWTETILL